MYRDSTWQSVRNNEIGGGGGGGGGANNIHYIYLTTAAGMPINSEAIGVVFSS